MPLFNIIYRLGLARWTSSFHIGASGLVYALASFLFSGCRKHHNLIALSMIVVFLYGGMVWGIFPSKDHISWEGHLFEQLMDYFGLYFIKMKVLNVKNTMGIRRRNFKSLDGIEVNYEEVLNHNNDYTN